MRRLARALAIASVLPLLALVGYEAFALWRAMQRTPAVLAEASRGKTPLSALPDERIHQLLAVEDPGFLRHKGVDFQTPGQGLTTITQGLVKIFYFDTFSPGFAKIEQSLIARFVLDPAMSKRQQLEAFINHAYFGENAGREIVGFDSAARAYFGKPLTGLSGDEYLALVAMLMAPNTLDPVRHPRQNAERVRRIRLLLAGRCKPGGLRDVTYESCARAAR